MASNPQWCLSLDGMEGTPSQAWIDQGNPDALLNASIFFDFRPLFGRQELAGELRQWLMSKAAANPRFLHQMAANALRNRPPLGLMRDFVVGEENKLDLKLNGFTPFVDAARIFSLAANVPHTNTVQRLRMSAAKLGFSPAETGAWVDALHFIQLLRLRRQHEEIENGSSAGQSHRSGHPQRPRPPHPQGSLPPGAQAADPAGAGLPLMSLLSRWFPGAPPARPGGGPAAGGLAGIEPGQQDCSPRPEPLRGHGRGNHRPQPQPGIISSPSALSP